MPNVKCKVNSCHYYGAGDICTADTILVDNNQDHIRNTRMEVGTVGGDKASDRNNTARSGYDAADRTRKERIRTGYEIGDISPDASSATTSEATCCRTFRPKGSVSRM